MEKNVVSHTFPVEWNEATKIACDTEEGGVEGNESKRKGEISRCRTSVPVQLRIGKWWGACVYPGKK